MIRPFPDPTLTMTPEELVEARQYLELTQAELGKLIDLDKGSISRMERGVKPIERRTIFSIRFLFQLSRRSRRTLLDVIRGEGAA